jgi:hypothetical protein
MAAIEPFTQTATQARSCGNPGQAATWAQGGKQTFDQFVIPKGKLLIGQDLRTPHGQGLMRKILYVSPLGTTIYEPPPPLLGDAATRLIFGAGVERPKTKKAVLPGLAGRPVTPFNPPDVCRVSLIFRDSSKVPFWRTWYWFVRRFWFHQPGCTEISTGLCEHVGDRAGRPSGL